MGLDQEIAAGEREGRLHHALRRFKAFMHRHPVLKVVHKVVVTLVGGLIVLAGLVMLVTPGPGWLAIFLGLGVLATEYPVVHRFNAWCKAQVLAAWHRLRDRRERRRWARARAVVLRRRAVAPRPAGARASGAGSQSSRARSSGAWSSTTRRSSATASSAAKPSASTSAR